MADLSEEDLRALHRWLHRVDHLRWRKGLAPLPEAEMVVECWLPMTAPGWALTSAAAGEVGSRWCPLLHPGWDEDTPDPAGDVIETNNVPETESQNYGSPPDHQPGRSFDVSRWLRAREAANRHMSNDPASGEPSPPTDTPSALVAAPVGEPGT